VTTTQTLDLSVDLLRALLWQYNDATKLQGLLQAKQAWYDANQTGFWSDWVRDVFDLRTANDFGLSVWAILLDIPLVVTTPPQAAKPLWGFGSNHVGFTRGNFAAISGSGLTTEQRRLVLRLRYFQLTTRATVSEVNAFMAELFKDFGPVYVSDGLNMTARYVFGFPLGAQLEQVLSEYDLLPRPAGVAVDYIVTVDAAGWGFGRYHETFNNGNFHHA